MGIFFEVIIEMSEMSERQLNVYGEESSDSSHQFHFIPMCKHDGQQLQNRLVKNSLL